jgi:gluconolactonase
MYGDSMDFRIDQRAGRGFLIIFIAAASMLYSQSLGTVNLPRTLADSGTAIQNMIPIKPQRITYCEGPAVDKNGNLFFSEQNAGIIWKIAPGGTISKWKTNSPAYSNGLDFGPDGYLYCCEQSRITKLDTMGTVMSVVTSGTAWGQGANDLTFSSNGDLFFTSFNQHIWFHSKDSSINRDYNFASPTGINFNGIEYIEEKGMIYLCQWGRNRVVACPVSANGIVDTAGQRTFATVNGPDGITVDANYNVYIASNSSTTGSIIVYDSLGTQLGTIAMRQDNNPSMNASNCAFGGTDNKTLYITGDSGAYKVQLKVAGRVRPGSTSIIKDTPHTFRIGALGTQSKGVLLLLSSPLIAHRSFTFDISRQTILYSLLGRKAILSTGITVPTAVYNPHYSE